MISIEQFGALDIITSSMALLFEPPQTQRQPISESDVIQVMKRPVNIGQTASGLLMISSNRDQKEIHLLANKLDVRDLSGDIDSASGQIPMLLRHFWGLVGQPSPRTLGLNIVLEANTPDSQHWLADYLISDKVLKLNESSTLSKTVSITFDRAGYEWTLAFSAPGIERLVVNFSASMSIENLPDDADLSQRMKNQFSALGSYLAEFK